MNTPSERLSLPLAVLASFALTSCGERGGTDAAQTEGLRTQESRTQAPNGRAAAGSANATGTEGSQAGKGEQAEATVGLDAFQPRDLETLKREESELFTVGSDPGPKQLVQAFYKRLARAKKRPPDLASARAAQAISEAVLFHIDTLEGARRRGRYPLHEMASAAAAGQASRKFFDLLKDASVHPHIEAMVFDHFLKARKRAHHYEVFADPLMTPAGVSVVKRMAAKAGRDETRKRAQAFAAVHRDLFGADFAAPKGFDKKRLEKTGVIGPPDENITKPENRYTALMKTTQGEIEIELYHFDAPLTVTNFITLVRNGFYDGLKFHRVIEGFMAQGGDPDGTGRGGPGYKFGDEWSGRYHRPGTFSMANAGPGTNGSQFFLCFAATHHLNSKHTVFGQVIGGMEVLKKLKRGSPQSNGMVQDPDKMLEVTVYEEVPRR